jgi:hypothetical protein
MGRHAGPDQLDPVVHRGSASWASLVAHAALHSEARQRLVMCGIGQNDDETCGTYDATRLGGEPLLREGEVSR